MFIFIFVRENHFAMKTVKSILVLCALISSNLLFGWGQTGHRAIGQVATEHLSKKARKNIEKLMGSESLAIASIWMDEVRSDSTYDHTHDWHWVTIPDGMHYTDTEKNPDGDVVEAIGRMKNILLDDSATDSAKVVALRFLVHMVGDMHQPLHVGNGEDRGGNSVKVKWFYQSSNLHRVWDSEIIDSKQLSYTELAMAVNHPTNDQIEEWSKGSVEDWAHEAMTYRPQVYNTGDTEKMGYLYMYQNWDLVQLQIEKAGVRLAVMLNEIFG